MQHCPYTTKYDRYKFDGELSLAALKEWLSKWEDGRLKPYRRTGGAVVRSACLRPPDLLSVEKLTSPRLQQRQQQQ
jgi:hypothetical protein